MLLKFFRHLGALSLRFISESISSLHTRWLNVNEEGVSRYAVFSAPSA
jgi:hypothetical protein